MTGRYDKYVQKLNFDNDGPGYYRHGRTGCGSVRLEEKVEKTFLLMDVRPFGSGPMNAGKL